MKKFILTLVLFFSLCHAQDTISYQWPFEPFHSPHSITGTFCEYRPTLSSLHFHDGTDIPKPGDEPVYPVMDGIIVSTGVPEDPNVGSSAWVRVGSTIQGMSKHITYVHINPNRTLGIGDSVKTGQTVLGYILVSQGHVHLTERKLNSDIQMNALRYAGGLSPFVDTLSPVIHSVKFYIDNSNTEFVTKKIFGPVDIVALVGERNIKFTPTGSNLVNNGSYLLGYKILSAGKDSVIYNPPVNGDRLRFAYKPLNSSVGKVFFNQSTLSDYYYTLTNGTGNIGAVGFEDVTNNFFNSSLYPAGNYQLMVYAQDTHSNADTVYVPFEISTQDVVAPAPPILKSVLNDSTKRITVSWYANQEPDVKGYRLYSSINGSTWQKQKDETVLSPSTTHYSFNNISSTTPVYFKLTAVDSAAITNESIASDIYGLRPNLSGKKVLIIDAFDRTTDSYTQPSHPFAMTAGQSINAPFETAHNNAVVDGSISLANYDAVFWSFGDEGTLHETFGTQEQAQATTYLQQGGNLFVSGSEIGYDLDRATGPSQADRDFLNNFLKADFAGDESGSYIINGIAGSFLDGVTFSYGDTAQGAAYPENYPDYFTAFGGSSIAATYGNGLGAATAFTRTFSGGSSAGAVVLLGIPFETIHTKANRDALMTKVLNYFGVPTSVIDKQDSKIPVQFSLEQNYPNPFNPTTTITFTIPNAGTSFQTSLRVYDLLGKEIAIIINDNLTPGSYKVLWNAQGIASGVYFYKLTSSNFTATKKLVLIK